MNRNPKLNRNFYLIVLGLVISLFGSAIQRFSFSLYLLDLTKDAAVFSNVIALSTIPYIICAPLAGMVADTMNRKKIMVVLDLCSFAVIGVYMLLQNVIGNQVLMTAVVMFLLSLITTFYTPAVTAMIPEIVGSENLVRANAMVSQVGSVANLAGPVLAGILYGILGISAVTFFNGSSFLLSAVMELFIVYQFQNKKKVSFSIKGSFIEMGRSYHYLRKVHPVNLKFIYSYGMFNIAVVPVMTILMPFVIRTMLHTSSEVYGIVEAVVASGMIAGTFLINLSPRIFTVKLVYRWYFLMTAAVAVMIFSVMICFNQGLVLWWTLSGFVIMMATGIGNVVTMSHTQRSVEVEHLGKVSAFSSALATFTVPIGQIIFGWYLELTVQIVPLLLLVLAATIAVTLYVKDAVRRV